ncbi:hypothetical protein JTE90_012442 [Oedothorax gibbosus]|uniref:Integrase catalytic domain-containing protein n=1 Tax=Oedothorax gibbosus TaxID=931172 RepID=A0AAV6U1E8_9ARAC|nr:hypothetical protein JTE90_012442 [Oedothorax gibbosus]
MGENSHRFCWTDVRVHAYMFLVIVDAHSKWLEVYPMKSTTTFKTIESLRDCFARFGLPVTLVSDNGPQFTSHEFKTFMNSNGIKHTKRLLHSNHQAMDRPNVTCSLSSKALS